MQEVVFDIGNVLLRWDPRNLYRSVFAEEAAMEAFLAGPLSMAFILETDIHPRFADLIEARAREFPEAARELRMFDARWRETLGGAIGENVALMRRLKARGARVHALSNFAREKFVETCADFSFLSEFDVAVVSGFERVAKPDRRIFEILVERTGRRPDQLLFIDDAMKNVEAARAFGIETIHYGPGVDLARELVGRGLIEA